MGVNNANFPDNVRSETEAIQYLGSMMKAMRTGQLNAITGSPTLTGPQIVNAAAVMSGGTTSTVTTPTAAAIIAEMKAQDPNAGVGSTAHFTIQNDNSGTMTFAAGSNVTLSGGGATSIAAGAANRYLIKMTGANAVTIYDL
jgi:hypothetical protein